MKNRRRGYTLVEMLVVMTVLAAVLGTVTLSLHAMYRSTQQIQEALVRYQQLDQLAVQFRSDAHQAVSAVTIKPVDPKISGQLRLTLQDESTISYRLLESRIDRIVRNGNTVSHQESYLVQPAATDPLVVDQDRPRPLVTLRLQDPVPRAPGKSIRAAGMQLEAAVGLLNAPVAPGKS